MSAAREDTRLDALIEAGITISRGLDLDETLGRLVDLARELTDARYGALGVLDETHTRIARFITRGVDDDTRAAIGHPPVGRGILGALIRDARPLRLAELGVPVTSGDDVFGNLYLTEKRGGDFDEVDEGLVVTLAAQAGAAIRNARLYAQATDRARALERALAELSTFHEIAQATLDDRGAALDLIAERARATLGADDAGIALPDAERGRLIYRAVAGEARDRLLGMAMPVDGSKAGMAFRARRAVVIDDLRADDDAYVPAVHALGVRGLLVVPLVHASQSLGVITVGTADPERRFGDDDRRILEVYATRATLALEMGRILASERERADAEARLATAELREAARRDTLRKVVEAQEQERRRIARELHDETGQALASVLMGLRLLEGSRDEAAAAALLGDLRDTVNGAIGELRSLAVELRPTALDDFGLGPAVERLGETFARRSGIAVHVGVGALERLPEDVETALYRIAQEALTNVAKHAGASRVDIAIRADARSATLVVGDDGRGFDPGRRVDGLGLVSMRERAELLGGRVRIDSEAGGGTTVVAEVPLWSAS